MFCFYVVSTERKEPACSVGPLETSVCLQVRWHLNKKQELYLEMNHSHFLEGLILAQYMTCIMKKEFRDWLRRSPPLRLLAQIQLFQRLFGGPRWKSRKATRLGWQIIQSEGLGQVSMITQSTDESNASIHWWYLWRSLGPRGFTEGQGRKKKKVFVVVAIVLFVCFLSLSIQGHSGREKESKRCLFSPLYLDRYQTIFSLHCSRVSWNTGTALTFRIWRKNALYPFAHGHGRLSTAWQTSLATGGIY